jgi:drug/metabolite transporter (DMT)-like permease
MAERNAPLWLTVLLALAGVVLVVVAIVYFVEPAHSLPSFFPGHSGTETKHHTKHGIAALLVGLAAFAVAWISTGTKSATRNEPR